MTGTVNKEREPRGISSNHVLMAVGRWFVKVSLYLSFVILLSIILAPSYTEHGRITTSSFLLASNGDKHCFPS